MKQIPSSLGWLAILLPFMCIGIAHASFIHQQQENRSVKGFQAVQSSGSFRVHISLGNTESLRLEGPSDMLQQVETIVEDGTLKIRTQKNFNWFSAHHEQVSVYITAKHLTALGLSGSGSIEVSQPIHEAKLHVNLSGSGSIACQVNTQDFASAISGSGHVKISGKTENSDVRISGSGKLEGTSLNCRSAHVRISGSGKAYLTVNQNLNAEISGSGSIYYAGSASNVHSSTSGSGKVRRM